MTTLNLRTTIYLGGLVVAAMIAAVLQMLPFPAINGKTVAIAALFAFLLAAAMAKPLPFGPHAHLMLDTAVILSAILILPPGLTVFVVVVGALASFVVRKVSWGEIAFGTAQTVLQTVTGLIVLSSTGWWNHERPFQKPTFILAVVAVGITIHLVNTLAIAGILSADGGEHPWTAWRRIAIPGVTDMVGYVAQWGMALLAAIIADAHSWGLILLVLPGLMVLSALDRHVTLRVAAEEKLINRAHHDALTGLLNRAYFTECLEHALASGPADRAILFLDLDRFKQINDTLGHEAGDQLLKTIASRIRLCVGPDDLVARLGGDEFVILADNTGDRSNEVAENIAREMSAPIWLKGQQVMVSFSIGIAPSHDEADHADDLLRRADIALYQSKGAGRNRATVYNDELGAATTERAILQRALQTALAEEQIWLAYQPQIEFAGREVFALEALMRWDSENHGSLRSQDFLTIAEETGLILPFGRWVLNEACLAAQRWTKQMPNPPAVAVNLSARQLADSQLIDDVTSALAQSGLRPDRLRLEVSEEAAMSDPARILPVLRQLAALGVRLVLDDFGAGRSSLPHLADLPVESLALDRALVSQVGERPRTEAIIRAITRAAHELGFSVSAKGIEWWHEEDRLRVLGCAFGQGYLYGEPLPEQAAIARIIESTHEVELAQVG